MTFSREDVANYEKQSPPPVESEAKPVEQAPAPVETTSVSAETPQVEPVVSDGSTKAETAESAAATAVPDGEQVQVETEAEPASATSSDGKPRRNEARERIEELVAERNALRKYGEYLLKTVDELKTTSQPKAAGPQAPTVAEDPAPTLEQHQFDPAAFAKAQNEWVQRQVEKRVAQAVEGLEARRTEATMRSNFEARTAEFRKTQPDYDIVIGNPALPALAPNTARLIVKSETGPQLAYHLAKNPDLATRISRMDPDQQGMAIGRLEAQLQVPVPVKTTPQVKRTVTQAPPPPKPVSSGSGVVQKDINQMSMDEFVAHERAKKLADRELRQRTRKAMR
jgi:hypothetical protein